MSPKRKGSGKLTRMLAYLRQSDSSGLAEDDPRAQSIAQQRDAIQGYAAAYGIEIVDEVAERDVSGGLKAERRGLGALLERVEAGEAEGIITYDVSRLGRNISDFLDTVERMDKAGAAVVAVKERVDTTTKDATARFFLHLMAALAEMERGRLRERFALSVRNAAARGVHPTRTPVGYVRDEARRLAPDPVAGPAVAEMFTMRARGSSLQECADVLKAATGKGWSRSSVRQMFTSQTYLGRIAIGDSIYEEGTHPALVDARTWQMAQREGRRPSHDGSLASQGVLAGLIRCAGCGHVLTVSASGPQGARVASYTCRRTRASGDCPAPASGVVAKVDAIVLPGIEERSSGRTDFGVYFEATAESARAFESAVQELDAFLEGASMTDLGAELYNREVARRRGAVAATREVWERDAARAEALIRLGNATSDLDHERARARQAIEAVTLAKADPKRGRWQPIAERLEVTWR